MLYCLALSAKTGEGSAPAVVTAQARPARARHGGYQGPARCPGTAVTRVASSGLSTGDTASGDTVSNNTGGEATCCGVFLDCKHNFVNFKPLNPLQSFTFLFH